MKKRCAPRFIIALALVICFLVVPGCKESQGESDGKSSEMHELLERIAPLQIRRPDGSIETITLAQIVGRHHNNEHHATAQNTNSSQQEYHHQDVCIGVATGYTAIRYAVDKLFTDEVPEANDFDIKVIGTMDGTWDVFELYTGRELERCQNQEELNLRSSTFVAKRISTGEAITFKLRSGLIPEKFFELKDQGITCNNPMLKNAKRQAVINILSIEPARCFESFDFSMTQS